MSDNQTPCLQEAQRVSMDQSVGPAQANATAFSGHPATVSQMKRQQFADDSPQVQSSRALQRNINTGIQARTARPPGQTGAVQMRRPPGAAPQIVQRAVTPTPTAYKDFNAIKALNLTQLHAYANEQADWHAAPALTDVQRNRVRATLAFVRSPQILATCGTIKVYDLDIHLHGSTGDVEANVIAPIRTYAKAVADSDPFEIDTVTTIADAVLCGKKVDILTAAIPTFMLRIAMYQYPFNKLTDLKAARDLAKYYTDSHQKPYFQTPTRNNFSNDFSAYTRLKAGKDPLSYDSGPLKGNIRNYHRFDQSALDKLATNFADTSKSKPLTLILHSAIDHNGAFIRDSKLTALINNANLHVLMLEGKEDLAGYTSQINGLATKYGQHNKIDQLMFAGHGNSGSIQLGGKVEEDKRKKVPDPQDSTKEIDNPNYGKAKEVSNGINVSADPSGAKAIFDEVLDNMNIASDSNKAPHRRILFNACLTNSNSIPFFGANKPESEVRAGLKGWLDNNKNLVDTVLGRATAKNSDLTKVVGSMASHGALDLVDGSDNLELISAYDPKITAADKMDYVKDGKEPLGVMRAVHELWAKRTGVQLTALKTEVSTRSNKGSSDWRNILIETCFKIIAGGSNFKDADLIKSFQFLVGPIDHGRHEGDCRVSKLSDLFAVINKTKITSAQVQTIFTALKGSNEWGSKDYIPTVFLQFWMQLDGGSATLPTDLASHIDGKYANIETLRRYIDVGFCARNGLFARILKNKGNKGQVKLAALGAQKGDATCIAFLKKELVSNKFPTGSYNIDTILGATGTEDDLLIDMGVKSPPAMMNAPIVAPNTNVTGNFTPHSANQNTHRVESVTLEGNTKNGWFSGKATVYKLPNTSSANWGELDKNTHVHIMGASGNFWGIEFTKGGTKTTGFVQKSMVKLS